MTASIKSAFLLALGFFLITATSLDFALAQQQRKRSTPIETALAVEQKLATTSKVDGRIVVNVGVNITAPKSGHIIFKNVKLGERVRKNDIIATIDVTDLKVQLDGLLLQEQKKQTQIKNSQTRLDAEERRLNVLKQQYDLLKDRLQRVEILAEKSIATQSSLAEINIRNFEKQQQIIQTEISLISLRQAQDEMITDLAALKLSIADLKRQINDGVIKSPIDGQIISLADFSIGYSRVGDILAVLQRDEDYEIEADIPLDWMDYLRHQKQIEFTNHRGDLKQATFRIELPQENPRSRTRLVRLIFSAPIDDDLRAIGASVTLMIPTSKPDLQITIPSDALIPMQNGYIVFVVKEDKAFQRQVSTGGIINGRVIITNGLESDEHVVIKGNELLSNGQDVKVINPKG